MYLSFKKEFNLNGSVFLTVLKARICSFLKPEVNKVFSGDDNYSALDSVQCSSNFKTWIFNFLDSVVPGVLLRHKPMSNLIMQKERWF